LKIILHRSEFRTLEEKFETLKTYKRVKGRIWVSQTSRKTGSGKIIPGPGAQQLFPIPVRGWRILPSRDFSSSSGGTRVSVLNMAAVNTQPIS
jgi:hypothetical protein